MARDFWQTVRKAVRIDKIKKSLTIPAGTYNCGFTRASLYQVGTVSPAKLASNITLSNTQVTIDFWAKLIPSTVSPCDIFALVSSSAAGDIRMAVTGSTTIMTIITSLNTYTFTVNEVFYHEWHRFTVTFSVTDNELRLYVDAELKGAVTTTGNLVDNDFSFVFGSAAILGQSIGYYNELALYATRKIQEAIRQTSSFKANIGAYGTNLQGYWKLNNLSATVCAPSVGAIDINAQSGFHALSTEEYAPIKFGASFVAVQYPVTLGYKASLQFPKKAPDDITGMFVVRWTDDDGVVQRRKLWDMDGVDIGPAPAAYNGEPLSSPFYLEFWNIDGNATAVIPSDIVLRVSKCSKPTTSYDTTAVSAGTVTADSTLAEPFSLTLPATFASQQTY